MDCVIISSPGNRDPVSRFSSAVHMHSHFEKQVCSSIKLEYLLTEISLKLIDQKE